MRLLLVGNYGVGNLGDEALREYFLSRFPEIEWSVVTASSKEKCDVPRLPCGIRSFFRPWWLTLKAFRACDGVVFGGGTLFTDTESVFACFLWWLHAKAASIFEKPVFFAFQGIGPFKTRTGKMFAASALRNASFLSVRDAASLARAGTMVKGISVVEGFDPIFALLQEVPVERSKEVFAIIPRGNASQTILEAACIRSREEGKQVSILSLQPEDHGERAICEALLVRIPGSQLRPITDLVSLAREVARCDAVFTARYHGAIAALALDVPFEVFSQGAGDKLASLPSLKDRPTLRALVDDAERALRESLKQTRKSA